MFSVEMPLLRAHVSSSSLHKNCIRGSGTFTGSEYPSGFIPGQLASSVPDTQATSSRQRKMSKSFDITRLYNQQRKVRANSKTTNHIHRGVISFRPRNSHSNSRQNKEVRISSEEYLSRSQSSKRFSSPSGYNSIMFGIDSKCSPLYEAHPTTSLFLETIITRSRNTHSSYSTSKITSSVVVKFSKHHEGQIFTSAANKYNHNDQCFKNRLWGSCRQAFHSGHMVRIPKETTYKLPGVGGSVPYSKTLSSGIEKPQCLSQMRQYNSGPVYKQTRGNKITTSVFQNMGSMGFCHRKLENNIQIKAAHILGIKNKLADQLSRNRIVATEWTLHRPIVDQIFHL